jgi:hypothetical protein
MMETLWDAIAKLFGGGSSPDLLPGDMPGDPNHHRPPGYDPAAAQWAQISRALLEAGARVASAPPGQAVGQGLQGFIEGGDAAKRAYENALLNAIIRDDAIGRCPPFKPPGQGAAPDSDMA